MAEHNAVRRSEHNGDFNDMERVDNVVASAAATLTQQASLYQCGSSTGSVTQCHAQDTNETDTNEQRG
jgi:hypothetical protein